MILLDTSVLSRVFRRRRPQAAEATFRGTVEGLLKADVPIGLPSICLQELLSGIRSDREFNDLHERLHSAFSIIPATVADHVEAARLRNLCLAKGVDLSGADCLIAAMTIAGGHELLATDDDFAQLARHAPLRLFDVEPFVPE